MYSRADGLGVYVRLEGDVGIDTQIGVEAGRATNRSAFDGKSIGGCAGTIIVGACSFSNEQGLTLSGTAGVGTDLVKLGSDRVGEAHTRSITSGEVRDGVRNLLRDAEARILRRAVLVRR